MGRDPESSIKFSECRDYGFNPVIVDTIRQALSNIDLDISIAIEYFPDFGWLVFGELDNDIAVVLWSQKPELLGIPPVYYFKEVTVITGKKLKVLFTNELYSGFSEQDQLDTLNQNLDTSTEYQRRIEQALKKAFRSTPFKHTILKPS